MTDQEFFDFIKQKVAEGQRDLSNILKALIYRTNDRVLKWLDLSDDRIFLEPMLCAFFHAQIPSVSLEQSVFGYIKDNPKLKQVRVTSDAYGTVYIPNLGYFDTRQPNSDMNLFWEGTALESKLAIDKEIVPFVFRNISQISGTLIEVYQTLPPLFKTFFSFPRGNPINVDVARIASSKREQVEKACSIIRLQYSHYFEALLDTVRGILIYYASYPYSFANMGAHGVAFLNANLNSTTIFFLEDILHQCSHIIFNAATYLNKSDIFAIDPETLLSSLSELDDYHGTIYEAFHGLFTQTNINRCLKICRESGIFTGEDKHELEGRISDDMKRFGGALKALGQRKFYTGLGWGIFCYFRDTFLSLYQDQHDLIERFDTSNQPYIFSYEKFLERNPLP